MFKTMPLVVSAFAFSALGLIAAFGIAMFAPTIYPANTNMIHTPVFERAMFIVLPVAGLIAGWVVAYISTPFPYEATAHAGEVSK